MRNDLAALVGSRICHDLISPIGAIGNGVELLSLTQNSASEEMSLITESVENANSRIRFFRIAYGAAGEDQIVARTEVLSVLAASARGGRFSYFWQVENDQSRQDVRVAFLVLQCLETAMPLGGDIEIALHEGQWDIVGKGPRIAINQPLWDTLTNSRDPFSHTAAEVQFALLPKVLTEAGRKISIAVNDAEIRIAF